MTTWHEYPRLRDRNNLYDLMRQGLSLQEIAREIGCSVSSVRTALRHHGIQRPIIRMAAQTRQWLNL